MTGLRNLGSVSALALLITPAAAFADITAQQVWSDWQEYFKNFGYTVDGSESTSGDTLTVSGAVMAMELPEGAGSFKIELGDVALRNLGDGRVSVNFADSIPMTGTVITEPGKTVDYSVSYLMDGFTMIASGDASALSYDYSADDVNLRLDSIVVDDKPVEFGEASAKLSGVEGTSTMTIGANRSINQRMSAKSLSYAADIALPDSKDAQFTAQGGIQSLTYEGSGQYSGDVDVMNLSKLLASGFAFDGVFSYLDGAAQMKVKEASGQSFESTSQSQSGTLAVSMDEKALRYEGVAKGGQSSVLSSNFPMPIDISFAEGGFKLVMPTTPSDEARDAAIMINMSDFTMSDMIWGLFDPTGKLSRDPATLLVDVSSKVKLFANIFDPDAMKGFTGPVGEPQSVTINALRLDIAGAELSGKGDFTFDKTDTTSFPGMPAPEGALDLNLTGANGLLDNLTAIGILPADKAMGARMMMGLFAVPGEGADTLKSKIEINHQGHVLANGQRLK